MRIERVTARAFGPFRDDSLDLAAGLTVVSGPNESGKTSWHAATRAALCGVRRGRGAATRITSEFAARHRPWDGPDLWEVGARIALDDGRTVEMTQDLAGKVACRATEVGLGRDVSDEIIFEGTPDASRWLGLDRDAFAATICVNQAQILAVADSAPMLQDHMQRAAATRGTDATAAEAIERVTTFRRESVGLDRENARGPLRLARNRLALAQEERDAARRQHDEYLELVARLEVTERAATEAHERLNLAEAAFTAQKAADARRRAERVRELSDRHPTRPDGGAERGAAADLVAAALAGWAARPTPVDLTGPTAEALERELGLVPPVPDGDIQPHPTVAEARRGLERAHAALELLAEEGAGESSAPERDRPVRLPGVVAVAVAGALAITGIALAALGITVPGVAAIVAAFALCVWVALAGWRARGSTERGPRRSAAAALEVRRRELEVRAESAGDLLRGSLQARRAAPSGDPLQAVQLYEQQCRNRGEQAAMAGRAEPLRSAIAARRAAEQAASDVREAVSAAQAALATAAGIAGVSVDGRAPDELVAELQAWQAERAVQARRAEEALAQWQELQALLSGATLVELESIAADLTARADGLAVELGATPPVLPPGDLENLRDALRQRHEAARREADELAGGLEVLSGRLSDVAEAEEAVAAADAEWDRVQALAVTLDLSLRLLRDAQERVHRDLAPVLTGAIVRWLPKVSAGRYADVAVDPADLTVQVKEADTGRWREARLLSEGTREQIYLLLRVAMAQHLVTTDETAPLLLDEVTAQSDPERKVQLLEVLHMLSEERQVILFSHDAEVAAWAARELKAPQDRLVSLGVSRMTALAVSAR